MKPAPAFWSLLIVVAEIGFVPAAGASDIRSDEVVVFFPTSAHLDEESGEWVIPIHGWIFEPERNSLRRRAGIALLRNQLGLEAETDTSRILEERLRAFIVDNESGKRIEIMIGEEIRELNASYENGHFQESVRVPRSLVNGLSTDGWLTFTAVTRSRDDREFPGRVQLVPPRGLSVISDIDDTLKVSNVTDRGELIRRTFLMEFEAVEGMSAFCDSWKEQNAAFHYVSSSPWQLYPALSAFFEEAGFPEASWHLKEVSVDDLSLLSLLADPLEDKLDRIERILSRFPERTFVLVGDSGERDPEVYGELARRHPEQVSRIFIRVAAGDQADGERFEQAFRDVFPEQWTVFDDPGQLQLD